LKLGHQSTETVDSNGDNELTQGTDDSDDESSVLDVPPAEQTAHLRSLFQNEWLSVDTRRQTEQLKDSRGRASAPLQDVAKRALQKLIPSKDEFLKIARSSSKWLVLLHYLLPQPFTVISQQELIESYDSIHQPGVTAISLATWLLTLAITAQQEPQEHSGLGTQLTRYQSSSGFSHAVSDTVERTILSHDRLIRTVEGLGMSMHFVRL
jgi:hypothetical protein